MKKIFPYILLLGLIAGGCEIFQEDILPENGFTKIYNHPDEHLSFFPESVLELEEGGYIFLSSLKDESSEFEYPASYLVRTSASGELEWAQTYNWFAPCSKLIRQGNSVAFVAMNQQFESFVITIDPETGEETGQQSLEVTMPLSAFIDADNKLLVLGYDFVSRSSWISKFSSNYVLERSIFLPINTDLEYEVQRHLNKTGQSYPFYIGEFSSEENSGYFVNCFSNYTLRTVFLEFSSLNASGNIYSYQTEEGISALVHKEGSFFGFTSYYEGNNYILPHAEISVSSSQNAKDFPSEALYELTFKARVQAGIIESDSSDYALFISQTNSNSLVIYQYAMDSDNLLATIYKDFDEKVEVKDFVQTSDKGIAVLASIHILGKYRRPLLLKFPKETFIPEEE